MKLTFSLIDEFFNTSTLYELIRPFATADLSEHFEQIVDDLIITLICLHSNGSSEHQRRNESRNCQLPAYSTTNTDITFINKRNYSSLQFKIEVSLPSRTENRDNIFLHSLGT